MPANAKSSVPRNPDRINIHDPAELKYWAAHLGVKASQLSEYVMRVGVNVADVKRAIAQPTKG